MRTWIALFLLVSAVAAAAPSAVAAPLAIEPTSAALARAMRGHRVVLLGEVHDNADQHALRAAALRQWIMAGARPAIAFEQFDREHQADIDHARGERPMDADHVIAQAQAGSGWDWALYRPYVALALEFDLPIVATNLSRADAMRVATDGWDAVFDAATRRTLRLDALPAAVRRKQQSAIRIGHCNQLPAEAVPQLVRAQVARDIVMAQLLRTYAARGVVLLAGNGHVRRDIGVPFWLGADARRDAISIGVLERDDRPVPESAADFDAYVLTARAERADPCEAFTMRRPPAPAP